MKQLHLLTCSHPYYNLVPGVALNFCHNLDARQYYAVWCPFAVCDNEYSSTLYPYMSTHKHKSQHSMQTTEICSGSVATADLCCAHLHRPTQHSTTRTMMITVPTTGTAMITSSSNMPIKDGCNWT